MWMPLPFRESALDRQRPVLCHPAPPPDGPPSHAHASRMALAAKIAELLEVPFAGSHGSAVVTGPAYIVAGQPLLAGEALALGILDEHDLFGGVVPHPFMATKCITHPLVHSQAEAPLGWNPAFADEVADAVLPGFTCYDLADASTAGRRLLALGAVRLKLGGADGGHGQSVARDVATLDTQLAALDPILIAQGGLVLEQNLSDVTTISVGHVTLGRHVASYCGTQRLTRDRTGAEVYGGSTLHVVRGGFAELLDVGLDARQALAVRQARLYDAAAAVHFRGFFASRRNYDIVQGTDSEGRFKSGVLEQSWRPGGASPAEVLALLALRDDPQLKTVTTCCEEYHGPMPAVPDDAWIYYHGDDAAVGPLTKYARILARTHAS